MTKINFGEQYCVHDIFCGLDNHKTTTAFCEAQRLNGSTSKASSSTWNDAASLRRELVKSQVKPSKCLTSIENSKKKVVFSFVEVKYNVAYLTSRKTLNHARTVDLLANLSSTTWKCCLHLRFVVSLSQ